MVVGAKIHQTVNLINSGIPPQLGRHLHNQQSGITKRLSAFQWSVEPTNSFILHTVLYGLLYIPN